MTQYRYGGVRYTPAQKEDSDRLNNLFTEIAEWIVASTDKGPARKQALARLKEASMWANHAIVLRNED